MMFTKAKSASEIAAMRVSGRMNAQILRLIKKSTLAGMSTQDLADIAKRELQKIGGEPTFLGYQGFPDVLCVSLNDEIVHGIPSSSRLIKDGDVVSLDFGVTYQNMITDHAITLYVGRQADTEVKQLITATEESLTAGISVIKDGIRVGDIAASVQKVLELHNLGIVRDLVGHGTGHQLHEEPNIPNYGLINSGPVLNKNMTIAIEPMATLGSDQVYTAADGWTVKSADGSLSAHFEHTILITEDGFEILTKILDK